MGNFNWQTEEDSTVWEEQEAPPTPPSKKRRWVIWLLMVGFVALSIGSTYLIYRQINERVAEAVKTTESAVLTSHELVIDAAMLTDRELFTNLLSGRDLNWTATQIRLLQSRMLFNRPHMGLQTVNIRSQRPEISLSPDLTQAIITRTVTYEQLDGRGEVELAQVAIYRQGEDRWLLAPLTSPDSEWQFRDTFEGRFVSASFPTPDAELALRMARDLDRTVDAICSGFFDVTCPIELHYNIDFSTDPSTLIDITLAAQGPLSQSAEPAAFNNFRFPTPTLIGLPLDENGYNALYRGYARVLAQDLMRESLQTYWASFPELQPYSLRQHLHTLDIGLTIPVTDTNKPLNALFAQDLIALCMADEGVELARYEPATDRLTSILSNRVFTGMRANPNDSIVALEELFVNGSNSASRVSVWTPGRAETFVAADLPRESISNLEWQEHPSLPRLIISQQTPSDTADIISTITMGDPCLSDNCIIDVDRTTALDEVIWSESGDQTLVNVADVGLFIGDASGRPRTFIGSGFRPFWLDETSYAYLTNIRGPVGGELYTGQVEPFSLRRTIGQAELLTILSEEYQNSRLFVPYAGVNPSNSQQIVILALAQDQLGNIGTAFVFLYDRESQVLTVPIESNQMHSFSISPDGLYLQATIYDLVQETQSVHLYNLQSGDLKVIPLAGVTEGSEANWSQDGQWLLFMIDGYLHLINAETGEYVVRLPGGTTRCFEATWVNKTNGR